MAERERERERERGRRERLKRVKGRQCSEAHSLILVDQTAVKVFQSALLAEPRTSEAVWVVTRVCHPWGDSETVSE